MAKRSKETTALSKDELVTREREIREQLFKLRLQKVTGQLANTSEPKALRKELARVKTAQTKLNSVQAAGKR